MAATGRGHKSEDLQVRMIEVVIGPDRFWARGHPIRLPHTAVVLTLVCVVSLGMDGRGTSRPLTLQQLPSLQRTPTPPQPRPFVTTYVLL